MIHTFVQKERKTEELAGNLDNQRSYYSMDILTVYFTSSFSASLARQ